MDVGLLHGALEYYQCPPGYCQCSRVDGSSSICNNVYHYDDGNDNQQCICDRQGIIKYGSTYVYIGIIKVWGFLPKNYT